MKSSSKIKTRNIKYNYIVKNDEKKGGEEL